MITTEARERQLRQAGYSLLRGEREWIERVITRAIAEDASIYHACWLDAMDRLDESPRCTICDGRMGSTTAPNPHWLCVKRLEHGVPIQKMDYVPECGCTPCRQKAGTR